MKKTIILSFLLLLVGTLLGSKIQHWMTNTNVSKNESTKVIPKKDTTALIEEKLEESISDDEAQYGDWPDSVIAELKLMDSLLNEMDSIWQVPEEDYNKEEAYLEQVEAVEAVDLTGWKEMPPRAFKRHQLKFERVEEIYAFNEEYVKKLLLSKGINSYNLELHLRAFKDEGTLEVWAKAKGKQTYQLLLTYPFYKGYSELGPKKREGDHQVPEGFYYIDYFNPTSSYKVSLRINYPNAADSIRNAKEQFIGGAICIHGHFISVGCLAITDLRMPNVYLLATEAKDKGQDKIPVHIFPTRLTTEGIATLEKSYQHNTEFIGLWKSMLPVYEHFERTHQIPKIATTKEGTYVIKR